MADDQTKPTKSSVAAFIDALTDETRRADAKALVKLMQRASGEKPVMWGPSNIGFSSYHYTYESGREGDMPVICFSPRKAANVLYNMTGFSDSAAGYRARMKATDLTASASSTFWSTSAKSKPAGSNRQFPEMGIACIVPG